MKREDLLKFYLKYRFYFFPAAVVLSSLFLIVFAIYPQTVKLINNQKTANDLISKSNFLETKVVALEGYNEKDLSQKVGYALEVFPPDKEVLNVLGLVQNLAARFGFNITSISFGNSSNKAASTNSYTVKLEVKGARVLFQTLLDNLENSPRLVKISSIDISSNQVSQSISATLEIEVLYAQLPQSFGTIDSPLPQMSQRDEELIATLVKNRVTVSSPESESSQSSPRGKSNPFE